MTQKIGFIGTGKAAYSLGRHIASLGGPDFAVSGYLGKSEAASAEAAAFVHAKSFPNASSLFAASDLIIFAVPDGSIASVWNSVRDIAIASGKTVAHLSGLHSSGIFDGADSARTGSIHPIAALFDKKSAYTKLKGAYFTIEGGAIFQESAAGLLKKLGNPFAPIVADKKVLYHAASSTVSNLVCAITYAGASLYKDCGLPKDFAENAWRSLFLENAKTVAEFGPVQALTGPLERGDADTLAQHLHAISEYDPRYADAYLALSTILLDTAREKHPTRDYAEIEKLLSRHSPADTCHSPTRSAPVPSEDLGNPCKSLTIDSPIKSANDDVYIINNIKEMKTVCVAVRQAGRRIGLVPTMGALHEGHLSLIRRAADACDLVIVSIFVNPIQFDDKSDLARYPKDLDTDAHMAADAGAGIVFAPTAAEMYPGGFSTFVDMTGVSERLCGASREAHFRGVCTVVTKLFHIISPDFAYFGEKDAQQLAVVRKMARELSMPVTVVGCPTVREPDGLAMSSRNARLSPPEREAARCLYAALKEAAKSFAAGETNSEKLRGIIQARIESEPGTRIDYIEIVNPETFIPSGFVKQGDLAAVAVYIGTVRLIDNIRFIQTSSTHSSPSIHPDNERTI
jgi:pantoate--beta-alanine ligase